MSKTNKKYLDESMKSKQFMQIKTRQKDRKYKLDLTTAYASEEYSDQEKYAEENYLVDLQDDF